MTEKVALSDREYMWKLARENFVFDNTSEFLEAVAKLLDKICNKPGDILRALNTEKQKEFNWQRLGISADQWKEENYNEYEVELYKQNGDGHGYVVSWFSACIEASGAEWKYSEEYESVSIDIDEVASYWDESLIPRGVKLLLDSTPATSDKLWHLLWDWFLPVVPLRRGKVMGKQLTQWNNGNDEIVRLSLLLSSGVKKPPVRLVWAALPALRSQQGINQLSLLEKKDSKQLDSLVKALESYCTPP